MPSTIGKTGQFIGHGQRMDMNDCHVATSLEVVGEEGIRLVNILSSCIRFWECFHQKKFGSLENVTWC